MSKARSSFHAPSGEPQIHKLTLALQKVGHGHSGKIPYGAGAEGLPLVITDYFSKWVEAKALSRIPDLQIQKFMWTYIITRFGVPHEIGTGNGPQFTSHNYKEFCKD